MQDNPFGSGGGSPPRGTNVAQVKEKIINFLKKGAGLLIIAVLLVIVGFNSIYIINSGEQAVITRFGDLISTETSTGLRFKFPFIDRVDIVNFENLYVLEFGFRSNTADGGSRNMMSDPSQYQNPVVEEAIMLTGDLNIVHADWTVIYKVNDSYNWLFRVDDPLTTLRIVSESTYRRVVASHVLDDILTDKKDVISAEIKTDLQSICNKYQLGVEIRAVELQDALAPEEVRPAFNDVSAAREEKEAKINEARKYENEKLPVANGQAVKMVNDAEGYKAQRINDALGATARYAAIEAEYAANPGIMRTRLYLEMIREVLPKVNMVYFVDESGNTLKFLPLGQGAPVLPAAQTETPAAQPAAQSATSAGNSGTATPSAAPAPAR